jgi:hypothetical protein
MVWSILIIKNTVEPLIFHINLHARANAFLYSNLLEQRMKKIDVVVVGSLNIDFIYRVKHLPAPGETITALSYQRAAGGKGANQAVVAARQGATVGMIGCVG